MATFVDEIDAILSPSALVPGGLPPLPRAEPTGSAVFVDEIDAILNPEPAPEPQATNMPGVGSGVLAIKDWLTRNPAMALEIAAQTLTTGAGIAGGAVVAGPPGAIAGGAAGNVAGKQIGRRVGQALNLPDAKAPPDLASVETAIDAGLGAVGPVASSTSRPLARVFTGASPKVVSEQAGRFADITRHADDAAAARATGREADLRGFITRSPDERAGYGSMGRAFDQHAQHSTALRREAAEGIARNATETAEQVAQRSSGTARNLTNIGAIAHAFTTGDLATAAAIFGGGHALSAGQRRSVERLMQNERFVNWLNQAAPKTSSQLAGSLGAILAEQQLTPAERADITALQGIRPRRTEGATYDANVDRHRDPAGRFVGGPIPHGTRMDGSHPDDDDQGDEQ